MIEGQRREDCVALINDLIKDCKTFDLIIEPGAASYEEAGVTIVDIAGETKEMKVRLINAMVYGILEFNDMTETEYLDLGGMFLEA